MSKLILATGMDELDEAIRDRYAGVYTIESISYLQGLTVLQVQKDDIAILTRVLPDSGAGDYGFVSVVEHLRRYGVRVIFLDETKPRGDTLVGALIRRGVYDLLLQDELVLDAVFAHIDYPATYGDVEDLLIDRDDEALHRRSEARGSLTFRKESEQSTVQQEKPEQSTETIRPTLRLGIRFPDWRRGSAVESKESEVKSAEPRFITVTGLPGAGVSFVALHLARAYAEEESCLLVEANDYPIFDRWLGSPKGTDGANSWVKGSRRADESWRLDDLEILSAVGRGPSLSMVRKAGRTEQTRTIVSDVRLGDLTGVVDVLVVPPDPEKIALLSHLLPRLLVINMTPKRLPVDPAEYALKTWRDTVVTTCPFVSEQSIAVITGQALDGMQHLGNTWREALG